MTSMTAADVVAFRTARPRLFGIAYRVLGSPTEADDVVQEAWIRWQATDSTKVRDASAFLATTTTRLAINVGQSARARHETSIELRPVEPVDTEADPALAVEQREALEHALRIVLEKLSAAERAVYILREAFDYPYRQIADVLALSEVNARQVFTRARRRLSGEPRRMARIAEQQRLVHAFVAAAQTGEIADLERLLAADVVGYGDVLRAAARAPRGACARRCRERGRFCHRPCRHPVLAIAPPVTPSSVTRDHTTEGATDEPSHVHA